MSILVVGRGNRRRYKVRWWEEGHHRQKTLATRTEAETFERAKLTEVRNRRDQGAFAPAEPSPMLLSEWVETWWRRDSPNLAQTTLESWANILDTWVVPFIGAVRLRELGQARLREYRSQIITEGRHVLVNGERIRRAATRDRANKAMTVLSAALGAAVRDGLLPANPCQGIRKLSHRPTKHRAWPPVVFEQIRAEMDPRDALIVSLMYLGGLRPAEALALTWRQVGEQVLVIDQSAPEGKIKATKTGTSGAVHIVSPLAQDLSAARPAGAGPDDLVVRSRQGGVLDERSWRAKIWRPAVEAAGVGRITPYDGRHTFGSLLIHQGDNVPRVAREMRHANATMTLSVYTHEFQEWELREKVPLVDAVREAREQVAQTAPERAARRAAREAETACRRSEGGKRSARKRAERAAAAAEAREAAA